MGCTAGKIIPQKIKKPEITKTLNISSGRDIPTTRDTVRQKWSGVCVCVCWGVGGGACFNSICSFGSDKKHSEERNHHGMTTVHPNNNIIPCRWGKFRMINCYVRQICCSAVRTLFSFSIFSPYQKGTYLFWVGCDILFFQQAGLYLDIHF